MTNGAATQASTIMVSVGISLSIITCRNDHPIAAIVP
jgi:hypothetical protein